MEELLGVYGRLHMLVLHMPLGIIVALAALELVSGLRKQTLPRSFAGLLVVLCAFSAALAATSGWRLGGEEDYSATATLFNHRWLGVALASCSVMFGLAFALGAMKLYRVLLFAATVLLFPVGHYGGTMTHGKGFLTEPLKEREERAPRPPPPDTGPPLAGVAAAVQAAPQAVEPGVPAAGATSTYESVIAPILAGRCTACHGEEKQKGKLAMHTIEGLRAGGSYGSLLSAEPPEQSELLYRIELPEDDPDHMPPEGKPQLTPELVAVLRAWIQAGAPFEGEVDLGVAVPADLPVATQTEAPEAEAQVASGPDPAAVAALTAEFVHVETLDPASGALWVDFTAIASGTDDARAARLLEPVLEHVAHLNLARTDVGADTLELCARMPRLSRLDLRATAVDDDALARLGAHPALTELVIAQTGVSSASLATLSALPRLERLFVWGSGLTAEDVARLSSERPGLEVDDGTRPGASALEEEPEVKFTKQGEAAEGEATAAGPPEPVNSVCPVSGSPVDPRYGAIYDGVVVGFCCPNCPKQFWEDPAGFLAKIQ